MINLVLTDIRHRECKVCGKTYNVSHHNKASKTCGMRCSKVNELRNAKIRKKRNLRIQESDARY